MGGLAGQTAEANVLKYGSGMDTATQLRRLGDTAANLAVEYMTEMIFAGGPAIKGGKFNL